MNDKAEVCKWTEEDPEWGRWNSGCGQTFCFDMSSSPDENDFAFCPYCGKPLEVIEPER